MTVESVNIHGHVLSGELPLTADCDEVRTTESTGKGHKVDGKGGNVNKGTARAVCCTFDGHALVYVN